MGKLYGTNIPRLIDLYGAAVKNAAEIEPSEENEFKRMQAWLHAENCRKDLEAAIEGLIDVGEK